MQKNTQTTILKRRLKLALLSIFPFIFLIFIGLIGAVFQQDILGNLHTLFAKQRRGDDVYFPDVVCSANCIPSRVLRDNQRTNANTFANAII